MFRFIRHKDNAMDFVPVPNTARFELIITHLGIKCENVFHLENAVSSWTNTDLSDAALRFKTWWDARLKPLVTSETQLTKIVATSLHTQISPKVEYTTGMPVVGNYEGEPMPGNVTIVVKWVTGNRGRSARGRTFHIGIARDQILDNELTTTFAGQIDTAYGQLMPTVEDSFSTLRVVSLQHNKVRLTTGTTYRITGYSIDRTVDTQRRRLF